MDEHPAAVNQARMLLTPLLLLPCKTHPRLPTSLETGNSKPTVGLLQKVKIDLQKVKTICIACGTNTNARVDSRWQQRGWLE